jgi:hypothetical protein
MPSSKKLSELQQKASEAHRAYQDAIFDRNGSISDLVQEFQRATKTRIEAEWQEKIESLRLAAEKAKLEAETLAIEESLSGSDLPYPLGTVLHEWEQGWWSKTWRTTGRTAVAEIITHDSRHPANRSEWTRARPGTFVLRIQTKNGPGISYESNQWDIKNKWFPAGSGPKSSRKGSSK